MDTDFHSELSVALWYDILCFFMLFTVYVFLLYITVLLPVGIIKDGD